MNHFSDPSTSPDAVDPLLTIASEAPEFPDEDVRRLLLEHYGLDGELTALVSERDQNCRLTLPNKELYVLKIANATEDPVATDFQIKALLYLQTKDVSAPRIIDTLDGNAATSIAGPTAQHVVRLVSYLPGIPFGDVHLGVELAQNLGKCLAMLGQALRDFEHPGNQQVLLWDMQRASDLRDMIAYVSEPELRIAITQCLDDFEANALPILPRLRSQVIHNDLNPGNALVDASDNNLVTGVIDFGDLIRAPLIIDVAVAASYMRVENDAVLGLIIPFVVAYDKVTPLESIEIELLYDLIRTRLITTMVILRWRLSARGEGDVYSQEALESERGAERFFLALNRLSRVEFVEQFQQARLS
jgi:hydroxylysine kinase